MGKMRNGVNHQKTIIVHSAPSIASIDQRLRDSSSVVSQNKYPLLDRQLYYSESINSSEYGKRLPIKRRAMTPNPAGEKDALRRKALKSGTQRFVQLLLVLTCSKLFLQIRNISFNVDVRKL